MEAIIWYATWPVLIYAAWRFVWLNVRHAQRMEKLETLENQGE